ncbi:hypothetical protein Bolokhovo_17 [Bacillus phage Bolokhovo]|uniref:Uncharacterized protein n=2 Tax=Andromedavirus curly TaxID=1273740 RepID=M1IDH0_9CAUD|nr:hypothetical protein I906_gp17 [Bacillus phage Curly]AGE60704.1 hypothetical protein CURLY_17 [Bacillus phage Curly]QMS41887.1 hypothetical protein Bolokhovo_17 [Bacillus phage Bolokhovo]
MKYEALEQNVGKVGVQVGDHIEIDSKQVADKLIKMGVIKPVKEAKEEAPQEETKEEAPKKQAPKKGTKKKEDK